MKTVTIYELNDPEVYNKLLAISELEQADADNDFRDHPFTPCTEQQQESMGFAPTKIDGKFATNVDGDIYLRVAYQTKKPKKNQVDDIVKRKVENFLSIHTDTDKVPSAVKSQFKDEAVYETMALTYPDKVGYRTVVFKKDGKVFVEDKSKKAEVILSFIRICLGSLALAPISTPTPVSNLLDEWVKEDVETEFTLGNKVELVKNDGETAKLSDCPVGASKAAEYLKEGAFVAQVEVNYDGMVTFMIDDGFTLSSINFAKEFKILSEDDSTATYMQVRELSKVVNAIINLLDK